ncbi:nicotinate-nucleotide pyrophosphorylase [mine drainage metagenome]|uniref:nicotinate-nucleotide diphosphorylase (carboxylating) n=1 Tax=mine drainage metagenome TaxID=410659 RepID=A0A1J5QID0_9ZZZZ
MLDRILTSLKAEAEALGLDGDRLVVAAEAALLEDLGGGVDATSVATIPLDQVSTANFVSRVDGVVAGLIVAKMVIAIACAGDVEFSKGMAEGSPVEKNSLLLVAHGNSQGLLLAERSALNFLCHLSGIATLTKRWVDAVSGTGVKVRDTRKTTPGLRELEKFAVRMGGGTNHRLSLSDAAMIKDNHVLAAGGIRPAFERIRDRFPSLAIEVEVDSIDQISEALEVGADLILLDNMSVEQCAHAVEFVGGRARLEASGGITFETARAYALTGVDYIAIGALTHSAPNLDIGLDLMME